MCLQFCGGNLLNVEEPDNSSQCPDLNTSQHSGMSQALTGLTDALVVEGEQIPRSINHHSLTTQNSFLYWLSTYFSHVAEIVFGLKRETNTLSLSLLLTSHSTKCVRGCEAVLL